MSSLTEPRIVKIGTLYFIPVSSSTLGVDLTDLTTPAHPDGPFLVCTSADDQFHNAEHGHWVVFEIPRQNNGVIRSADDVRSELQQIYAALDAKNLLEGIKPHGVALCRNPIDTWQLD